MKINETKRSKEALESDCLYSSKYFFAYRGIRNWLIVSSPNFKESNIVIVYLLAVALSAKYGNGHVAGLFSAVASTFLFNYFLHSHTTA